MRYSNNIIKNISNLFILGLIFIAFACDPNIENPQGTGKLGTLVPEGTQLVYVSIGNSLTAGYQDGAVYGSAQQFSFPNLLAKQLGITSFVQPAVPEDGIGERMTFGGFTATGSPIINRSALKISTPTNASHAKPYNNLGIPGSIANDLIDESDFATRSQTRSNPFYHAFLRSNALGASMIKQAIALQPNLVSMWIGNNDVLGYATSGGTISTVGMPDNPIPTPAAAISQILGGGVQAMITALPNVKILLLTIPNVMGTPFFNVIPWNALVLTEQAKVDALNAAYRTLGYTFKIGQNGFIAESPTGTMKMKQLTANDKIVLTIPQDSLKAGWGTSKPIPNRYVLDTEEQKIVAEAVAGYNQAINTIAGMYPNNITVVDMNAVFAILMNNGYNIPGSSHLTPAYISGEFFSLDGIHPNSKGYGVIANEIIKVINAKFGADIPFVFVQNLPAIIVHK